MIDLKDYGYTAGGNEPAPEGCVPARVTAVHRGMYRLIGPQGESGGKLKPGVYFQPGGAYDVGYGSEPYPTVGDFVWIQEQPQGESLIVKTMARHSYFSRLSPDQARGEQLVAANFDYVFILMSLNQNFNTKRLERYLTASWQSGALPVVVLTKADLMENRGELSELFEQELRAAERAAVGVEVIPVSARSGFGIERLSAFLKPGKTIVFLGSSGVGKSSLVNALAGEELMKVREIREEDARGRHTTTHRELIRLPSGALVIDTPGMRELGMWEVGEGLGSAFSDIEELFSRCRFADCGHGKEPGCAVRAALEEGTLAQARWDNYLNLKREAQFVRKKEQMHQSRQRRYAETGGKRNPPRKKRGFPDEID